MGGGGVQPDYNQNDATALDYIKNRPFYTDDSMMETLYDETLPFSVSSLNDDLYQTENNAIAITFPNESAYNNPTISWDGVNYSCKLIKGDINGYGNFSIFNSSYEDTGEPFVLVMTNSNTYTALTKSTASSHHIAIEYRSTVVKKIDNKYLPMANKQNMGEAGIISVDNVEKISDDVVSNYMTVGYTQVNNNSSLAQCIKKSDHTNNPNRADITTLKSSNNAVLNGTYKYGTTDEDFTVGVVSAQPDAINCYNGAGRDNTPSLSWRIDKTGIIIQSSTSDSTKKFKITVDDNGTLTATEYNE